MVTNNKKRLDDIKRKSEKLRRNFQLISEHFDRVTNSTIHIPYIKNKVFLVILYFAELFIIYFFSRNFMNSIFFPVYALIVFLIYYFYTIKTDGLKEEELSPADFNIKFHGICRLYTIIKFLIALIIVLLNFSNMINKLPIQKVAGNSINLGFIILLIIVNTLAFYYFKIPDRK